MKKVISLILVLVLLLSFGGCFRKEPASKVESKKQVELVYYRLFDDEEIFRPLIQQYQAKNPNVKIIYRKFNNPIEYQNLILNELAEGEGPDLFSMPNYWFSSNLKKVFPAPDTYYSPKQFEDTFVSVASKDLVFADPNDGKKVKVFAVPMMVDTLALYYNKLAFEDAIPSKGKPSATWEELKDDVVKLSKRDNSFERFELAGIALGRADNILRAIDILYLMMLQYGVNFYNKNYSLAQFSQQRLSLTDGGEPVNPATEALRLFTSFGLASQKNYSWNQYLAEVNSFTKEIETFARGKVAMIFGYSYLYEQLKNEIASLRAKGVKTIDINQVRVAPVPQLFDPAISTSKRDAFANYYAEAVSRTSKHPDVAWDFLMFLTNKENLAYYNSKTKRPTSRRDMIEEQKVDPIYGVFAEQIGYSESLPIYDWDKYKMIFERAVSDVLNTIPAGDAIKTAENALNQLLPASGFINLPIK